MDPPALGPEDPVDRHQLLPEPEIRQAGLLEQVRSRAEVLPDEGERNLYLTAVHRIDGSRVLASAVGQIGDMTWVGTSFLQVTEGLVTTLEHLDADMSEVLARFDEPAVPAVPRFEAEVDLERYAESLEPAVAETLMRSVAHSKANEAGDFPTLEPVRALLYPNREPSVVKYENLVESWQR